MPLFRTEITTLGTFPVPERRSGLFGDPTTPLTAVAVWNDVDGGPTAAGEIINERTAMAISVVYTCVTTLAEAVASLPCKLMRRADKGRAEATDNYMYPMLAYAPNPEMTAFTFWSTMVGCSALTGNAYAQIMRDPDGTPNSFWPLHPLKTEPVRQKDGTLAFKTSDGMKEGTYRIIPSKDVLHFPLFSMDGIKGIGPVQAAREAFALAKAAEKYGARWFGNGAHADSVFIMKGAKPDLKVQREIRESWQEAHGGSNVHKQPFLFGDWDLKTIGLSPEDSQFLGTRNFQRAEIGAMFKLQPHQVGDTSRLSNANHVQAQLTFVTDTLRPICGRIEAEIQRKLLPATGRNAGRLFVTFDLSERLRGDFQTQMQGYAYGRQWGFLSVNDIREDMGLNPIGAEGDTYLYPTNMGDATQLLKDKDLIPTTQEPAAAAQENPQNPPAKKGKRSAFDTLANIHESAFQDALGRAIHREKRDFASLSAVFTPCLEAMAASAELAAEEEFSLPGGWNESRSRVVKDALKTLEKRAASWQEAPDASTELNKVVRGVLYDTYREAATARLNQEVGTE